MPIQILIKYLMRGEQDIREVTLSPEIYFEPLKEGQTFIEDGVERFNNAKDYLNISASELLWTHLTVLGTTDDREIRTQFLPDGESFLCHRKSPNGYEEFVNLTKFEDGVFHLLRIHKDFAHTWVVNYNGIIKDMLDGSQKEFRYDK